MMEKDFRTESCEIPVSKSIPFDNLCQIIQAFHKPIGVLKLKAI